jgi:hypothetical protein
MFTTTTLPEIPADLSGWAWEHDAGRVRLANPAEGYTTGWLGPETAALAVSMARARVASDAAVAAEEAPIRKGRALSLSTAEPVDAPVVEGVVLMSAPEARRAADRIKRSVEDLRGQIDRFDTGQGWKVLGFESFRAWALAEIPEASIRHVYRLREAAEVDRSLGVTIGHTPESHARELARVPAEERAEVLARADAMAESAGRARVAADVRAAARPAPVVEAPPTPDAELDGLIADLATVEARVAAGCAGEDDQKLLAHISVRADALGAFALGTRAGELLATPPPALPAGWRWRPGREGPSYWQAERVADGMTTACGYSAEALAAEARAWDERKPVALVAAPVDLLPLMKRAAAIGYNLLVRGRDVELVARDRTRGETYGDSDLPRLEARIAELEANAATVHTPTTTTTPPKRDAGATLTTGDWPIALIEDEDSGEAVVSIATAGIEPLVGEALAQIANALRLLALGQAHAVDTPLLDDLTRALAATACPARGTLIAVAEMVAQDADKMAEKEAA